eukprot:g2133.t1
MVQARVAVLKTPHFPGAYGLEAASNLSAFRSNILAKISSSFELNAPNDHPLKYSRYDRYPVTVSCPPNTTITRFGGQGDGGKRLCNITATEPCLIFSLGSNGDFTFERGALGRTPCIVHTFDCTYHGNSIHPRHHYHTWCLGSEDKKREQIKPPERAAILNPEFYSWRTILQKIRHTKEELHLLKADIEGFEFELLGGLAETDLLPTQLALEVHFAHHTLGPQGEKAAAKQSPHMSLLFAHLAILGYAIVSREDNMYLHSGCCSEFSFLLVENNHHHHHYTGKRGKFSSFQAKFVEEVTKSTNMSEIRNSTSNIKSRSV